jgi:hypothetical protein
MILDLVSRARDGLAKRKRYNQLVNEIQSLTDRDLADIRGNRTDMLRAARKQIYG